MPDEMSRIINELAAIREATNKVGTQIAGIEARQLELAERQKTEIQTLFELNRDHADRINIVERTYVDRKTFERSEDKVNRSIAILEDTVTKQGQSIAGNMKVGAGLLGGLQILVTIGLVLFQIFMSRSS